MPAPRRSDPQDRILHLYSAFLHDEIALGKSLRLTLGSKSVRRPEYRDTLITAPEYSRLDLRVEWRPTARLEERSDEAGRASERRRRTRMGVR
jgi:hypothetical protein